MSWNQALYFKGPQDAKLVSAAFLDIFSIIGYMQKKTLKTKQNTQKCINAQEHVVFTKEFFISNANYRYKI